MAKLAAIDLGSNALRLRIVEALSPRATVDGRLGKLQFQEVHSLRVPVRLGREVFLNGELAAPALNQACDALGEFRRAMDRAGVEAYRAVATAAVREARNGQHLVERVRRSAGIDLEVIDGLEEASIIQSAVCHRLPLHNTRAMLFDVGGGSTEFTRIEQGKPVSSISLPLGTVRLLERFVPHGAALSKAQLRALDDHIQEVLQQLPAELCSEPVSWLIGTGGNVETLAILCPAAQSLGRTKAIDFAAMRKLSQQLCELDSEARRARFALRSDRADTIVTASRIFAAVAARFAQNQIVSAAVGLREGLLIHLAEQVFELSDRDGVARTVLASCRRLGARFHYDEAHAERVERFASALFDASLVLHRLSSRDRLLLRAAATLHDIGDYVQYENHHKHSAYLIQHSELLGLRARERMLVSHIARYHRKGPPELSHASFQQLNKDERRRVRVLAALLRVADGLDRGHSGAISRLHAQLSEDGKRLQVLLGSEGSREQEEWAAREKADLLRDALNLDLQLLDDQHVARRA